MATYCTVANVLDIARTFSPDYSAGQINGTDIEPIILENEDLIRHILQPRFDIATIENNIPPAIKQLCAYKTALDLYNRYPFIGTDANKEEIHRLKKMVMKWISQIAKGNILINDNGVYSNLGASNGPSYKLQINNNLLEAYSDGARSY